MDTPQIRPWISPVLEQRIIPICVKTIVSPLAFALICLVQAQDLCPHQKQNTLDLCVRSGPESLSCLWIIDLSFSFSPSLPPSLSHSLCLSPLSHSVGLPPPCLSVCLSVCLSLSLSRSDPGPCAPLCDSTPGGVIRDQWAIIRRRETAPRRLLLTRVPHICVSAHPPRMRGEGGKEEGGREGRMDGLTDLWTDRWTDGGMDRQRDGGKEGGSEGRRV